MEKAEEGNFDVRSDEVEERILNAAMRVFSRNGYKGATTMKIANEADVNEITIFRKFQSKENLLKAVIEKNNLETLKKLDSILCREKNTDVEICIKTLGISLKQFMDERIDFMMVLVIEGRKRPEIRQLFNSFRKKMLEHLREYFKQQMEQRNIRHVDSDLLATSLFSFIFQQSISEKIFEDNLVADDLKSFEEYADVLMRGILNPTCDN